MRSPIHVLVADDSTVTRLLLVRLLESDPQIKVVGAVQDGQAAVDFVRENKPDAIVMDLHMPNLDGFEATRRIMETDPVPIIICTATTDPREIATTFRLLEAGAVACIEKPVSRDHPEFDRLFSTLVETVKLMSEVKMVRRWPRSRSAPPPAPAASESGPVPAPPRLIGIGASTGGPAVLQTVLAALPKDFPVPILVVQHVAAGFLPGLAEWLNQTSALQVHVGAYGTRPLPGHIYLAPDDFHMGIGSGGSIILTREEPENGLRPAVSHLFRTLAAVCGSRAAGVLLTGMGKDGARELKSMRDRGSLTIAQDHASSIVHGMPGEAIRLGGATRVLPPCGIAGALIQWSQHAFTTASNHEQH